MANSLWCYCASHCCATALLTVALPRVSLFSLHRLKGATATPSKGGTVTDVDARLKQLRADVANGVLDISPEEEKEMRRVILEGYVSR